MINESEEPPLLKEGRLQKFTKYARKSLDAIIFRLKTIKQLKNLPVFKREKKLVLNFAFLAVLVLIPWISEASVNQQVYSDLKKFSEPIDPLKAGEFAENLSPYTAGIEEKKDEVALALMLRGDSYSLTQQLAVNSNKIIDEPQRQAATYTVQNGETIMQIAEKFNLHVATILEANKIKAEDAKMIKPGTILNVPSSDTSTSSDWIVAINKAEEEKQQQEIKKQEELKKKKLAEAKKKTGRALAASQESSRQSSDSGFDGEDNGDLIVPISHRGISRGFGGGHTGTDYMADIGTPVVASASGKVVIVSTGWSGGYGNQIVIDHGSGRATRYAHLSSISVGVGQVVGRGQVIGYSGSTGRSTGPHLHFEVIKNGHPIPY